MKIHFNRFYHHTENEHDETKKMTDVTERQTEFSVMYQFVIRSLIVMVIILIYALTLLNQITATVYDEQ
jgi:hypothetical protein